jgi:hypothetical protein
MPSAYAYILHGAVMEVIIHLPLRQREQLEAIFRALAADPYQMTGSFFYEPSGRKVQVKFLHPWMISFWADHAVKEVRIVGLKKRPSN